MVDIRSTSRLSRSWRDGFNRVVTGMVPGALPPQRLGKRLPPVGSSSSSFPVYIPVPGFD